MQTLSEKNGIWKLFLGVTASSIVILLPVAFLGLDLEDRGFHIYEQLQTFNKFGFPSKMILLTNWLGGAWLSLSGGKFLYAWSVVGGLLLAGINLGIAALIVKELFPTVSNKKLGLFCLAGVLCAIYTQTFFSIDYYPVPLLTTELFLLFFIKSRYSEDKIKIIAYYILAGFFAGITPFMRLPTVYLLGVPLVYELLAVYYGAPRCFSVIYFYLTAIATAATGYFIFTIFLQNFSEYSIAVKMLERRSFVEILKIPLDYLWLCFIHLPLAIIILLLFVFVKKTKLLENRLIIACCFSVIGVLGIAYLYWAYDKYGMYFGIFPLGLYRKLLEVIPIALSVALLIPAKFEKNNSLFLQFPRSEICLQILMICGVFILFPFGSNTGLLKVRYGFPVLLPICFIVLEKYFDSMNKTFISIMCAALFTSLIFTPSATYCDANRLCCRYMPKSQQLCGIFSSEEKVLQTDRVVSELKKYTVDNEEILIFGVDYTILIAAGCRSWCNMGYNPPKAAKIMFSRYCEKKALPKTAFAHKSDKSYADFGKAFLEQHYKIVFEDNTYTVWQKQKL